MYKTLLQTTKHHFQETLLVLSYRYVISREFFFFFFLTFFITWERLTGLTLVTDSKKITREARTDFIHISMTWYCLLPFWSYSSYQLNSLSKSICEMCGSRKKNIIRLSFPFLILALPTGPTDCCCCCVNVADDRSRNRLKVRLFGIRTVS